MTDLFSKFDPLIEMRANAALKRGHRPVRPRDGEGDLAHRRDVQRARDDPARHLQLYGHDLRPGRDRGGQGQALDDFGSGTTGSRVLNGTYAGHKAVEER
jgi:hypothetical protein